jgi:hypothetical protein
MVWNLKVVKVTTPFDPPKLAIKERGKNNCKIFLKAHQDVLVNEVVQEITNKVTREIANQVACEDVTSTKGGGISWGESPRQGGT